MLTALIFAGCAGLNTSLPDVTDAERQAEQIKFEAAAFEEMSRLRARLEPVAHNVLAANRALCEKTHKDIGAVTQTIKSYPKNLRDGARRELSLSDEPALIYVRPDSAAANAGLKPGDRLISDAGEAMASPGRELSKHLETGAKIQRARLDVREPVTLSGTERCDYNIKLKMSSAINAYANGKSIVVTAGMMDFVESDDELAYIIGHELAHNTQSHIRKSITNYVLSLGGTRYTRGFESEADYVGLYFMVRAGYNPERVDDLWRRLARLSMRPIARAKTHPTYPGRALLIEKTRAEIEQKQQSGDILIPEPKRAPK
ncbi:MAG: M48 family metalloprotease [Hellea sp.]|nr:M48 family metalloprotease [Hellea sp.]